MLKHFIWITIILFSGFLQAKETPPFYQIDLIVFTHQQNFDSPEELSLSSTLSSKNAHSNQLKTAISKEISPYHLLPPSFSQLRQEYWALHRKPEYRVLFHYTWLQPHNSQQPLILPTILREGWQVEGSLRIRKSNYYLLDTELLFSPSTSNQSPFVFSQKQRLKGGEIYYLDHPQAGMLIKVHQLA